MVVESLGHAVKVRDGRHDDENVKDLMRAAPNVKFAGETSFREACLLMLVVKLQTGG